MCDARANGHADEHVGRRDPDSGEVEEHCITVNLASGLFWCRVCKRELTRADDSPVAGSNTATHKSNAALSPLRAVSEALSACNGVWAEVDDGTVHAADAPCRECAPGRRGSADQVGGSTAGFILSPLHSPLSHALTFPLLLVRLYNFDAAQGCAGLSIWGTRAI